MTSSDSVSSAVFYRVDGTNFAFGLEWMTAASNKQSIAQAKLAARKQNATHLAWRLSKAQVGLTRLDKDLPQASPLNPWRSAAAAFADLPYSSLLAAFKFRDGRTWILAATNGRIYAQGDRVFTEEEEARKYFQELFAQQYWNDIFAPADWQSRAKQIDPLAVLRRRRPEGRGAALIEGFGATLGLVGRPGAPLRPVTTEWRSFGKPQMLASLALVSVILAGGIGYGKWHGAHMRKPVSAAPTAYYPAIASGRKVLGICLETLPAAVARYQTPGWTITDASCNDTQLSLTLASDPDTPATTMLAFHPEADMHGHKTAVIVTPLPEPVGQEPLSIPLTTEEAYRNAFAIADEHANSTNIINPAAAPAGAAPTMQGRPRPRPYKVSQWSFDTTAPPLLWEPDLTAIANLEVVSVSLGISEHGLHWGVKGNAYVAP